MVFFVFFGVFSTFFHAFGRTLQNLCDFSKLFESFSKSRPVPDHFLVPTGRAFTLVTPTGSDDDKLVGQRNIPLH